MGNLNKTVTSQILDIRPDQFGKYQVFFTFSEVPVVMNRAYLETILTKKQVYHFL